MGSEGWETVPSRKDHGKRVKNEEGRNKKDKGLTLTKRISTTLPSESSEELAKIIQMGDEEAREQLPFLLNEFILSKCDSSEHVKKSDFDGTARDALQRISFLQALQAIEHFAGSVSSRIQKRPAYLMGILRGQEQHWDKSRAAASMEGGSAKLLALPPQVLLTIANLCLHGNVLPSDFTPEVCLSLHRLTMPLAIKAVMAFNLNKRIVAGQRGGVLNRPRFFQRLIQNVADQSPTDASASATGSDTLTPRSKDSDTSSTKPGTTTGRDRGETLQSARSRAETDDTQHLDLEIYDDGEDEFGSPVPQEASNDVEHSDAGSKVEPSNAWATEPTLLAKQQARQPKANQDEESEIVQMGAKTPSAWNADNASYQQPEPESFDDNFPNSVHTSALETDPISASTTSNSNNRIYVNTDSVASINHDHHTTSNAWTAQTFSLPGTSPDDYTSHIPGDFVGMSAPTTPREPHDPATPRWQANESFSPFSSLLGSNPPTRPQSASHSEDPRGEADMLSSWGTSTASTSFDRMGPTTSVYEGYSGLVGDLKPLFVDHSSRNEEDVSLMEQVRLLTRKLEESVARERVLQDKVVHLQAGMHQLQEENHRIKSKHESLLHVLRQAVDTAEVHFPPSPQGSSHPSACSSPRHL